MLSSRHTVCWLVASNWAIARAATRRKWRCSGCLSVIRCVGWLPAALLVNPQTLHVRSVGVSLERICLGNCSCCHTEKLGGIHAVFPSYDVLVGCQQRAGESTDLARQVCRQVYPWDASAWAIARAATLRSWGSNLTSQLVTVYVNRANQY